MSQLPTSRLYTDVNFLPDWYVQAQSRKNSLQRSAGLSIVVIVCMVALLGQTWHTQSELRQYHEELQHRLASTRMQVTEATKLRAAKSELQQQLRVHRQLHKPINYSQILGTLTSLMPPTIALTETEINTESVTVTRTLKPSDPRYAEARKKHRGKGEPTVSKTHQVISLQIEGVAPSDSDIANFIGALAASRLFENVKMIYSKKGTHGELITRNFRMRMQVPLNRAYRTARPSSEVADAH